MSPTKTEIISALRNAGHEVGCPPTGRTYLDGEDVTKQLEETQHDEWTLAEAVEHLLEA